MPVFVDSTEITDEEIFAEMQHHPAPDVKAARKAAARALAIRELLRGAAIRAGHMKHDADMKEEEAAIDTLLSSEIAIPAAHPEDCRAYFEKNIDKFRSKDTEMDRETLFKAAEPKIREFLQYQSFRNGLRSYIEKLAADAKIVGLDLFESA